MDDETIKAFATAVETSLKAEVGQLWMARTHASLADALRRGKFNTERAVEMFAIAIERAVLAKMGSTGPMVIARLRQSGITATMALELVDGFKQATGATDQRAARRGLVAMLIGK